ncbi:MAG: UDP-2,4-diacetamido-2,4,6-trideoxy-beta-L-altropyranose hydrolase, partial [Flavobacteriales bacterium]|nr:UDP-2,4-diacetamido-2,4,6-trideoxy-beta-L-altropyranose hydrolase [Flavobacteriales bacterium]
MKVVIRTDASLVMGTGHAVRCLTLAKALRERGATCTFVCREHPGHLLAWMRDQGFAALGLPEPNPSASNSDDPNPLAHASWLGVSMETDARETLEVIGEEQVDWLIVDHYGLDARWESIMRSRCRRIMVIDDLADRPHACELLLDQNLIDGYAERYQDRVPEHVGLMLGPEFALLQPEYRQLHDAVKTRQGTIESALIYFGGADRDNLTGKVLGAIIALECPQIRVDVVVNTSSPHLESIRQQIEGHPQIKLHQSVPSLAPMMLQ